MPRVKRGAVRATKRKAVLKQTKGYNWGRKKKISLAKTAIRKAGVHAFTDRRIKKRTRRALWQVKLNAAVRNFDLNYSKFINLLKVKNVELDRKVLADLAEHNPDVFAAIVKAVK